MLAARIDRLPSREKALVQTMSVIGREVPAALLSEVSDLGAGQLAEAVVGLAGAELVIPEGSDDDREYVFKHPLTQEVAYGSQLSERRARAHEAVAAAIERTYPAGLDERAALLAHHCEAAGQELAAAGWHARAGAWAELTSPADGMRHWQRVRALSGELEASPEVAELATKARIGILGLAWRLGMSPEETAAIHAEGQERTAAELASAPTTDEVDPESRERMLLDFNYLGTRGFAGHEREGVEGSRKLNREALASGDPVLALTMPLGLAYFGWVAGSLAEAVEACDRGLAVAGDDPTLAAGIIFTTPLALLYATRGLCAGYMGDLDRAQSDHERGIELAREYDDPEAACYAHLWRSHLAIDIGATAAATEDAFRSYEIAQRIGEQILTLRASLTAVAAAELAGGHPEAALERAEQGLALIREGRTGLDYEAMLLALIARAKLALDQPDAALAAAEEAVEIMDTRGLTVAALRAPIALAQVLLATQGVAAGERVEAVLGRAMEVARESGARVFEPQIHRELAALARLRGDEDAAERRGAEDGADPC